MDKLNFNTIEEAETEITLFCKDNNHPIRVESRRTVQQYNSKRKDESARLTDLHRQPQYTLFAGCASTMDPNAYVIVCYINVLYPELFPHICLLY